MTPGRSHSDPVGRVANKVRPLQPLLLRSEISLFWRTSCAKIFLYSFDNELKNTSIFFRVKSFRSSVEQWSWGNFIGNRDSGLFCIQNACRFSFEIESFLEGEINLWACLSVWKWDFISLGRWWHAEYAARVKRVHGHRVN